MLVKDLPKTIINFYKNLSSKEERDSFLINYQYFVDSKQSFEVEVNDSDLPQFIINNNFASKQKINSFFLKKTLNTEKSNSLNISEIFLEKISTTLNVSKLEKNISNKEKTIKDHINALEKTSIEVFKLKQKLTELTSSTNIRKTIIEEIDKIAQNSNFSNVYFDEEHLSLHAVTKKDCILKYGTNEYNLGKFDIVYFFNKKKIRVFPYENNFYDLSKFYYHPHVFENGQICYGNATDLVSDMFKSYQMADIFGIIFLILTTYNLESPLAAIWSIKYNIDFIDNFKDYYQLNKYYKYMHKNVKEVVLNNKLKQA